MPKFKVEFIDHISRQWKIVEAVSFQVIDSTATLYDGLGCATCSYTGVASVERMPGDPVKDHPSLATTDTNGLRVAWPYQSFDPSLVSSPQNIDAVGGPGCKVTTSEIKPPG